MGKEEACGVMVWQKKRLAREFSFKTQTKQQA
jgi:hypothetical protein